MSREAAILHADADAFFASVEQRDDPSLRGRPTVVGGGVVMAASYEARAYGIHGGMGGRTAQRLCPDVKAVEPNFSAYTAASKALFEIFKRTSPLVEGLSMEEAFLDVHGLDHISGTPLEIAARLRRDVRKELDLPLSVGVARTKVLAKMASRAAKPDGLLVVAPDEETAFLHPLPVQSLWGVGETTAEKLHAAGILTVGALARRAEVELELILGAHAARHLHAIAHNRDPRRVRPGRRRRSIGSQSALGTRPRSRTELEAVLVALVDRVTRRMRSSGRAGRTVTLRLRFGDFTRATRSRTLPHPAAGTGSILTAARILLEGSTPAIERRGITLLGIAVSNLTERGFGQQLELPLDGGPDPALDAAIDEVRDRFGADAIRRPATLSRERSLSPWLRPGEEPRAVD